VQVDPRAVQVDPRAVQVDPRAVHVDPRAVHQVDPKAVQLHTIKTRVETSPGLVTALETEM